MTEPQKHAEPAESAEVSAGQAEGADLFKQARAIFEAHNPAKLSDGRKNMEQAAELGNVDALWYLALSHLTGESGIEVDCARALQLKEAVEAKLDDQHFDAAELRRRQHYWPERLTFDALWRRCTAKFSTEACSAAIHKQIKGYRIYKHKKDPSYAPNLLVLEFSDGSEAEFVNPFGEFVTTTCCRAGGWREVEAYMADRLSSVVTAAGDNPSGRVYTHNRHTQVELSG